MACPRCGGCAQRVELITEEETITAESCLNCGAMFGDPLLDTHHAMDRPPDPRPDALTPVYDPELQILRFIERFKARERSSHE